MNDVPDISLAMLRQMMAARGVRQLLVKELAANDNSKNQPYLGGSLDILNILPMGEVREETTPKGRVGLKAPLPFSWLRADGSVTPAPHSQIILYPQYPEIRLSGFLKGTQGGPNALMTVRQAGRLLFFGITGDRQIVAWVAAHDSRLAAEIRQLGELERTGVLRHVPLAAADSSRERLLALLRDIHLKGWIDSWRMGPRGERLPCISPQCGGYTLEAELGIIPNGRSEPDFDGWEVKGHSVDSFTRPSSKSITLMTPEPTGGYYRTDGVAAFVRKYGYPDTHGRPDRLNFGGIHVVGQPHPRTGLTMTFMGFDTSTGKITDPKGGFTLADAAGNEAATWHFAGLLQHWNRKHAKAAYVPFMQEKDPERRYSYGGSVRLCEGTDFVRFLQAMAAGTVFYDPGIKLESASSKNSQTKQRSQFRIKSNGIGALYSRLDNCSL
jgi:hypothetical protein